MNDSFEEHERALVEAFQDLKKSILDSPVGRALLQAGKILGEWSRDLEDEMVDSKKEVKGGWDGSLDRAIQDELNARMSEALREMEQDEQESSGQERFAKFAEAWLTNVLDTLVEKGKQYSPGDWSATTNFEEGCVAVGLTPRHYLMSQANKQWYVLCQWAAGKRPGMRMADVGERAGDVMVYLLLLLWMTHGGKEE